MRPYLLLLCLSFPLLVTAQTIVPEKQQDLLGKGHLHVGVSVGQGYRGTFPTTNYVSPRIQYFISNGWSIALEGRFLKANSDYDLTYRGAALSTRYYFLRGNRFAVFAQLGTAYGQSKYDRYDPSYFQESFNGVRNMNWQVNAGLGAHYRLGKRWALEAIAERAWLPSSFLTPSYNRWQTSIGVSYRLR